MSKVTRTAFLASASSGGASINLGYETAANNTHQAIICPDTRWYDKREHEEASRRAKAGFSGFGNNLVQRTRLKAQKAYAFCDHHLELHTRISLYTVKMRNEIRSSSEPDIYFEGLGYSLFFYYGKCVAFLSGLATCLHIRNHARGMVAVRELCCANGECFRDRVVSQVVYLVSSKTYVRWHLPQYWRLCMAAMKTPAPH